VIARITNYTTLVENDKMWTDAQRAFFSISFPREAVGQRKIRYGPGLYLYAFSLTDIIHIGIIGKNQE